MKKTTLLIYMVFSSLVFSQKKITIYDFTTQLPVQYANVWKEKLLFVTADSTGSFMLKDNELHHNFKITAVGYKDTITKIGEDIYISPEILSLEEVKIVKRKNQTTIKLGKAKRGDSHYGVQWDSEMAMTAKYFANVTVSKSYLNKVHFFATTSAKNRMISVLVYSVGENGKPDKLVNTETIVQQLKKGTHKVEIDLNRFNIEFPLRGIFIIIQHPLLEQNKYYDKKSIHPNAFFYEPLISIDYTALFKDSWYYDKGTWKKSEKYSITMGLQVSD